MTSRNPLLKKPLLLVCALFKMARPSQLLAVALVYLLGTLIALAGNVDYSLNAFVYGLFALIPLSASIHYANEYADYETDALTVRTPFSGGSGALVQSGLPRHTALLAAWLALVIGAALALLAGWLGMLDPTALGILALGTFFGWMYSLPPLALAWRGWGELDNALLGGLALVLYGHAVQSGVVTWRVVLASLPFAALTFLNLLATTWADREADAAVGKLTLATRWSLNKLRYTYWIIALGASLLLFALLGVVFPPLVVWTSLLAFPLLIWGAATYTRWHSPMPSVAAMVLLLFAQIVSWGLTIWLKLP